MTTAPTTETEAAEAIAAEAPPAGAIAAPVGGLSLRKNFSWTFVGNVVYAACQWGILVVLAKLGTPEMVGQFALGLAVTAPVMMFSMLQLRGVQATDAKREYQFGDYLALRLITTALALAVIVGIVAVSGYKRETALVILIVGAMKGVDALSDVYYGLWQQHERMDGIAQALMLNGVLSTATLTAIMAATHNIVLATLGTATGSVGALAFTLAKNRRLALATGLAARPTWNTHLLWRLSRLALPLGVVMLLISLNTNIPRYVIQHYLGEAQLGIFAAIGYLMVAGSTIVAALGQSASPRLARYFAEGTSDLFLRLLARLICVAVALGLAGILIALGGGRQLLMTLYRADYAAFTHVFTWLMIAAGIGYVASFLGYALTAARHFAIQAPLFVVVTTVTLAAAWFGTSRFGLVGAAWAVILGSVVQFAGMAIVVTLAVRRRARP